MQAATGQTVDSTVFMQLVQKHFKHNGNFSRLTLGDQISPQLLEKAKQRIAPDLPAWELPILLFDMSPYLANLKCGILATDQALYWRNENFPFSKARSLQGNSNKTFKRRYDELRSIIAGDITFTDGRICYLEHDMFVIPMMWNLVGDSLISFLQIAAKQKPLETEEELELKLKDAATPKAQLRAWSYVGIMIISVAIIAGIIGAFVVNPRMLAPIGLALGACFFSSGKYAFPRLILFIVWVVVTFLMMDWIRAGF